MGRSLHPPGPPDAFRVGHVLVTVATIGLAALPLLVAPERAGIDVGDGRGAFETLGVAIVAFAAAVLAIPENAAVRPARNAFFAGLAVLAVSNLFATMHVLVSVEPSEVGFWPWVSARYVAGALFALAAWGRAPRTLARHAFGGIAVWVAVAGSLVLMLGHAPGGWFDGAAPYAPLAPPAAVLVAVPAGVFVVAAWLAARLYRRTEATEYGWLSLAFAVQVGAQLHQVLYPAFLGPWLTTADLLRLASFLLLAAGAVAQLGRLYRERSEALAHQEEDRRLHEVLLERWRDFADREADFRTIVTHELATPIATINAFAHVVTGRVGQADVQLQRAVDGIRSETRRLTELTERMDELRDLGSDDFVCDLRATNVADIVDGAVSYVRALDTRHRLHIDVEPERVDADPVRLGQALRNVLTNATTYSPPASLILIHGRSGDRYALCIEDAGPGISIADRSRVLQAYERGDDSGAPGHGVGLYVAARIAHAHGGELSIDAAADGGTRVTFSLSVAR